MKTKGFTVLEVLIAVCVLVIAITIAVPFFQNIQTQAQETAAAQMTSELNSVYPEWKASGGVETPLPSAGISYTSDILSVLGSPPGPANRQSPDGTVSDGGTSNMIGLSLPPGLTVAGLNSQSPTPIVTSSDYTISFDGNKFTVLPTAVVNQQQIWIAVATTNEVCDELGFICTANPCAGAPGPSNAFSVPEVFNNVNGQGQNISFGNMEVDNLAPGDSTSGTFYVINNGVYYKIAYNLSAVSMCSGAYNVVDATLTLYAPVSPQ